MTSFSRIATLLSASALFALAACGGDSTAELASPGNTGANPGTSTSTGGTTTPPPTSTGGSGSANCPQQTTPVTVGSETHCRLPARILNDLTLIPGNIYQLNSRMDVGVSTLSTGGGDPAVLTIDPGVTIYASDQNAYLVVNQGSKLVADGNVSQPIIFTSAADLGYAANFPSLDQRAPYRGIATGDRNASARGEWGGIVINGLAPTNNPTRVGEGSTGTITGGPNTSDNSGVIRYVQIRYAGFDVGLATGGRVGENELNGLALQAVGNGTVIDYLQVHNAFDDAIEMFGGTVDVKHLVVTGTNDDAIDWTDGWLGRLQFALVVMNPLLPTGDGGIEADNLNPGNETLPRSNPILSNITIIGANVSNPSSLGGTALFRQGTAGRFVNSIITNTKGPGLDIDGSSSYAQAEAGNLLFRSIFITSAVALATESDDGRLPSIFNAAGSNNLATPNGSTLTAQVTGGIAYINGPAETARPAFDVRTIDSTGFFQPTTYIGAVPQNGPNWTLGWTEFLNRGA